MTEIKPDTFPKVSALTSTLLKSMPDHLKDHANYKKIQKAILNAGASRHSHADVIDWYECTECQARDRERVKMIKGLGFKNAAQYMAWKKIHNEIDGIKTRHKLTDYK